MEISAPAADGRLPCRNPRLVSWTSQEDGHYLVRNRNSGETFRLGREEQFILDRLDGRLTAEQVRSAFAARFGQSLSTEELVEFISMAGESGFLQADYPEPKFKPEPLDSRPTIPEMRSAQCKADQKRGGATGAMRAVDRLLSGTGVLLQWSAERLKAAWWSIHCFHLRHFAFVPRPDDIFIVTYPRSGTTWMQMILYQLTTDGSMEIPHIAEYCPWFEHSLRSGLGFETRPPPRIFKSHLSYRAIPKGPGKYIYVARDGRDVAVSYYHLYRTHFGFAGTFARFFDRFIRGNVKFGSWFDHVRDWAEHRRDPNVLFLTYEELIRDLEASVQKIITFCRLAVPRDKLTSILQRCNFAFMKRYESKFDPAIEALWEQGVQLNSFIRNGKTGEGALQLNPKQQEQFEQAVHRHLAKSGLLDLVSFDNRGPQKANTTSAAISKV